ncbi:SRPBCC domain-containing protein, partial [Rhizobium ruizarguesonis]
FPHRPETLWKTLTTANLMGRWLMMPAGFEPVEGKRFTYQTTPAGACDGTIHCQVLEVKPNERLSYACKGGHEGNAGYGSPLN